MLGVRSKAFAPLFAVTGILLSSCSDGPPQSQIGWRKVGDLDGVIVFVEADPKVMRSATQYSEAADAVCKTGCAQVGFFLPGDLLPPSGGRASFFRNGGWKDYNPVAVKFGSDFTVWDCKRLNFPDAPQSALCGEGTHESYGAVLAIAVRDGWTVGCGLRDFGGFSIVKSYAASLHDEAKSRNLLDGYRTMYESSRSGPDDPSFCETGRARIENKAAAARDLLKLR